VVVTCSEAKLSLKLLDAAVAGTSLKVTGKESPWSPNWAPLKVIVAWCASPGDTTLAACCSTPTGDWEAVVQIPAPVVPTGKVLVPVTEPAGEVMVKLTVHPVVRALGLENTPEMFCGPIMTVVLGPASGGGRCDKRYTSNVTW
jgi:hypothetical protein